MSDKNPSAGSVLPTLGSSSPNSPYGKESPAPGTFTYKHEGVVIPPEKMKNIPLPSVGREVAPPQEKKWIEQGRLAERAEVAFTVGKDGRSVEVHLPEELTHAELEERDKEIERLRGELAQKIQPIRTKSPDILPQIERTHSRDPHDTRLKIFFRKPENQDTPAWWIESEGGKSEPLTTEGNINYKEFQNIRDLLKRYRGFISYRKRAGQYPTLVKMKDKLLDLLESGDFTSAKVKMVEFERELKNPTAISVSAPITTQTTKATTPVHINTTPETVSPSSVPEKEMPSEAMKAAQNFDWVKGLFPRTENGVTTWYKRTGGRKDKNSKTITAIPSEKIKGPVMDEKEWGSFERLKRRYREIMSTEYQVYSRSGSINIKNEMLDAIRNFDFNLARAKKKELEEDMTLSHKLEIETKAYNKEKIKKGPAPLETNTWIPEFIKEMGSADGRRTYFIDSKTGEWRLLEGNNLAYFEFARDTIQRFRNRSETPPGMVEKKNKILNHLNKLDFAGAKVAAEEYLETFHKGWKEAGEKGMAEFLEEVKKINPEGKFQKEKSKTVLRPDKSTYRYKTGNLWTSKPDEIKITDENRNNPVHLIDGGSITLEDWVAREKRKEEEKKNAETSKKIEGMDALEKNHRDMYARDPARYRRIYEGDKTQKGKVFLPDDPEKKIVEKILNENGGANLVTSRQEKTFNQEDLSARNKYINATSQNYSPSKAVEMDPNEQARAESLAAKGIESGTLAKAKDGVYTHISTGDKLASPISQSFVSQAIMNPKNETERIEPTFSPNDQITEEAVTTPEQKIPNAQEKENKIKAVSKLLSTRYKNFGPSAKNWKAYVTAVVVLSTLAYMAKEINSTKSPQTEPVVANAQTAPQQEIIWAKYLQSEKAKKFFETFMKLAKGQITDEQLMSQSMPEVPKTSWDADSWEVFNDFSGKVIGGTIDQNGVNHREAMSEFISNLLSVRQAIVAGKGGDQSLTYPLPKMSIRKLLEVTKEEAKKNI